jgi:hypothetical protein
VGSDMSVLRALQPLDRMNQWLQRVMSGYFNRRFGNEEWLRQIRFTTGDMGTERKPLVCVL